MTLQEVLKKHTELYMQRVAQGFNQKNVNATGRTLASIKATQTGNTAKVTGASYILALEYGRGATRNSSGSGQPLVEKIKEWIAAKGLNLNPYAVAKTIHAKGTLLYRSGKQSGLLTEPVKETVESLRRDLAEFYRQGFIEKRFIEKIRAVK